MLAWVRFVGIAQEGFATRMIMPIAARALRQTAVVSVVLFKS
jgi:hypothetical protein